MKILFITVWALELILLLCARRIRRWLAMKQLRSLGCVCEFSAKTVIFYSHCPLASRHLKAAVKMNMPIEFDAGDHQIQ